MREIHSKRRLRRIMDLSFVINFKPLFFTFSLLVFLFLLPYLSFVQSRTGENLSDTLLKAGILSQLRGQKGAICESFCPQVSYRIRVQNGHSIYSP